MTDTTNLNPAAVALAEALLKMLSDQIIAGFEKRITDLEAKLEDSKFDEAVMEVINADPAAVVDAIEDQLNDRQGDYIAEKVSKVIANGSFSIEFSRF